MSNATMEDSLGVNLTALNESFEVLRANTDAFFLLVIGILIFFMQAGFALLEVGSVRYIDNVMKLMKDLPLARQEVR